MAHSEGTILQTERRFILIVLSINLLEDIATDCQGKEDRAILEDKNY